MIELYFLIWRIPKMMSRLAREKGRSALRWSLAGVGAWLGAEMLVFVVYGMFYEFGVIFWGWPAEESGGMKLLSYAFALGAALGGLSLVRRVLDSLPPAGARFTPPPPPPQF